MRSRYPTPVRRLCAAGLAACLVPTACGDDVPDVLIDGATSGRLPPGQVDPDSSGPTPDDDDDDDDDDDAPGTTTGEPEGTGETGFRPPEAECGNGFVEIGEQCDDGNEEDGDDCNNACEVPCGLASSTTVLPPTDLSEIDTSRVALGPDGRVIVAGLLREITTDQRGNEQVEDDVARVLAHDAQGRVLWSRSLGSDEGNAAVAGLALDAQGDVVVAFRVADGTGAFGIAASKLDGDDGEELWRHEFLGDFDDEDDLPSDIAVAPDGNPVVAGHVRVADGDDDVWVRKLDTDNGDEMWTSTWSGVGSPTFSTDGGGPMAIDADGLVYVLATQYVDFETRLPTLLRFDADGVGEAEVVEVVQLRGTIQEYAPLDIAIADDGSLYYAYVRALPVDQDAHVVKVSPAGRQQWTLQREDFEIEGGGSDWIIAGFQPSGDELVVVGRFDNDVTIPDSSWVEAFVARVTEDGALRCQATYRGEAEGLVPPSVIVRDVALGEDEIAIAVGEEIVDGDPSRWIGRFRRE